MTERWIGSGYLSGPVHVLDALGVPKFLPKIEHIKVEEGPGIPLGRSFRAKTSPPPIFPQHGDAVIPIARPQVDDVRDGLASIE